MDAALAILQRAVSKPVEPKWRARIGELCADLFQSIKLQTSVPLYQASGYERGAVLDFVDHPLNNRWWLEDEFTRIRKLPSEADKLKALELIRTWEQPGPGSFYDEVGNIAKSPHVIRGEGLNTDPMMERNPNPAIWWWDDGCSRKRLSWQTSMDWPLGLAYHHLDPQAAYRVRLTGYGQAKVQSQRPTPDPNPGRQARHRRVQGIPRAGRLDQGRQTGFDLRPLPDEAHLNWRKQSRVSEVWLLKD